MTGMPQVAVVVIDEGERPHTVGFYRRSWEAEAEVHPHSTPEMVVVDVRTAAEMRILQVDVEKEGADTTVVL